MFCFGDPHECRRTNEILLRKFLASLKVQHRFDKNLPKTLYKRTRILIIFPPWGSSLEQNSFGKWENTLYRRIYTFGWKTQNVLGRVYRRLLLTYSLDLGREAGHFDLPRMPAKTWSDLKGNECRREIYYHIHSIGNYTSRTMTDSDESVSHHPSTPWKFPHRAHRAHRAHWNIVWFVTNSS